MKDVLKPLAKRVLIPLGLTAVLETEDGIDKKSKDQGWQHQ